MGTQPVLYAHRESNIQDRLNTQITYLKLYTKSSRSKSIHKPITSPVVQIYDFKRLLFLNKEIAMNFEIHKSDLVGTCRRSQKIVEANGRPDLVPIWMLAELIASNCTPLEENCGELLFSNDPFKKNILESLILHFAINGDIQTAVMLCAVFHKCCPENEPATKNILSPMGSPYHTVLPIDKFNTHLSEQSLAMQLKQNRSNSWSDSLDVQDSLKTLHQEKEIFTCSLIKKSITIYSQTLRLFKKGVEFAAECKNCGKPNKSPSCNSCKNMIMYCIICRLPVRGSANVCLICGHGGHTKHLESWFLNHDICPTGCGCQCLEENVALLEKVC
uniref:WDR59/RTC1-like RING zinc finger domain-containing protein n=1 Tax=Megaselia scalaris TaxID=36166 RepID=T1H053_MEGSC